MRKLSSAVLLVMVACGKQQSFPTSQAATEPEMFIVSEVARFSEMLGVHVVGSITDKRQTFGCDGSTNPDCHSFGFYDGGQGAGAKGTAYFYGPDVNDERYRPFLTDAAAHEVCHTQSFAHDLRHWCCMAKYATPTYVLQVNGVPFQGTPVCQ